MFNPFYFFFLFLFTFSFSQEKPPVLVTDTLEIEHFQNLLPADSMLKIDSITENNIYQKKFPTNFKNQYKGEDFNYTIVKPKESLLDKLKRSINKLLEAIFGRLDPDKANQYTIIILRFAGILIIGFLIYFLINYILNKNGNFFFSKKKNKLKIPTEDLKENINEIDFPTNISNYEREKNYRYAIRYQFLNSLKKLNDKNIIQWNAEKTNQDYLSEIKNADVKKEFKPLVWIFNHVWYGEFNITENHYKHFKTQFQSFNTNL